MHHYNCCRTCQLVLFENPPCCWNYLVSPDIWVVSWAARSNDVVQVDKNCCRWPCVSDGPSGVPHSDSQKALSTSGYPPTRSFNSKEPRSLCALLTRKLFRCVSSVVTMFRFCDVTAVMNCHCCRGLYSSLWYFLMLTNIIPMWFQAKEQPFSSVSSLGGWMGIIPGATWKWNEANEANVHESARDLPRVEKDGFS